MYSLHEMCLTMFTKYYKSSLLIKQEKGGSQREKRHLHLTIIWSWQLLFVFFECQTMFEPFELVLLVLQYLKIL